MTRPADKTKVGFLPITKKEFWPYYALAIAMLLAGVNLMFASSPYPALVTTIVAVTVPLSLTDPWKSGLKFYIFVWGEVILGIICLVLAFILGPTWIAPVVAAILAGVSHAIRTFLQKEPEHSSSSTPGSIVQPAKDPNPIPPQGQ